MQASKSANVERGVCEACRPFKSSKLDDIKLVERAEKNEWE